MGLALAFVLSSGIMARAETYEEVLRSAVGVLKISSADYVTQFSWTNSIPVIGQKLYRDGQLIADVTGITSLSVKEESDSSILNYQLISGYAAGILDQASDSTRGSVDEQNVDIKSALVHPSGIWGAGQAAQAVSAGLTTLRYRTFISDLWVDAPILNVCSPVGKEYAFRGDDRSYGPTFSSYRTSQEITVDWNSNGSLSQTKDVGTTKRYVKVGSTHTYDDSLTASDSTITLGVTSHSSSFVNFHIAEDVKNPFCQPSLTNGIFYTYQVHLYRSGSYTLTGYALAAPNHELYIRDDNTGGWTTIFKKSNRGFDCFVVTVGGIVCNDGTDYAGSW